MKIDDLKEARRKAALDYHEFPTPGKLSITATKQLLNQSDLALAYSPGVAAACEAIVENPLNAFRFMPGGGWLAIRGVDHGPAGIEIEVRDTGPGIVADDLPHIFDAGFSTRPGSSGLGLAVCRRILEQHGGTILVESRFGHGATFHCILPASSEVRDAKAPPGTAACAMGSGS